ncbi:DinB family protein [Fulvivirgaceae bacterium LMO-SS25]
MHPEIKTQWEKAEKARLKMLQLIANATEAQREFVPGEDKWNMLNVAQHLIQAENGVLRQFEKFGDGKGKKANVLAGLRSLLTSLLLKSPAKIKVPKKAREAFKPFDKQGYESVKNEWDALRNQMQIWAENYPDTKANRYVFKHPVSGLLTPTQTFRFLKDHIDHHIKQIERIRNAVGFPR